MMALSPHVQAELDCCHGEPGQLAAYLRKHIPPDPQVLMRLARYLEGSEQWTLTFTTRTGAKPKRRFGRLLFEAGAERNLALILIHLAGNWRPQGAGLIMMLADALDPRGRTKWKLKFARPDRGNPDTNVKTTVRHAWLGHQALEIYRNLPKVRRNWKAVDVELGLLRDEKIDPARRKRAVALVKRVARNRT